MTFREDETLHKWLTAMMESITCRTWSSAWRMWQTELRGEKLLVCFAVRHLLNKAASSNVSI